MNEYKSLQKRKKYLLTNNAKYNFLNLKEIKSINYSKDVNKLNSKLSIKNNYVEHYTNSKQIIIIIGSHTCPHNSKDSLALKILESYLSYGMSSLLFKVFRENNGLTYDSGVFYPSRKFKAPFLIYLSVSERNSILTLNLLLSIWNDLLSKKIIEDELSLAKLKLRRSYLHYFRNCEDIIFRKVRLLSLGMDPFHDEKSKYLLEPITPEDILTVTNKYLNHPCISVSGSKKVCNYLKEIWKKTY